MKIENWKDLLVERQRDYLEQFDPPDLAKRFGNTVEFYENERRFWGSVPSLQAGTETSHPPTKDLVESARRDLSFFEANFELLDNSVDSWRRHGQKEELKIHINYDLGLERGTYEDNAGGMGKGEVYKVFIPGETSNRDFSQATIGSFGMGAKKGIFRLSDGSTIISSEDGKTAHSSMVPEEWEKIPDWTTKDNSFSAKEQIAAGQTKIVFHKLFSPPKLSELDQLRGRIGETYKFLLEGVDPWGKKGRAPALKVWVNNIPVDPEPDFEWSAPSGAEPRRYQFSVFLENFIETGNDFTLQCAFDAGILTKQSADWGIDVVVNGRLVQKYLKRPFQIGTPGGLSASIAAHRLFRAVLHLRGHSFAIPWDTHKREYLADHPVSLLIAKALRPIINAYFREVVSITGQEQGTSKYLTPNPWNRTDAIKKFNVGSVKELAHRTSIPTINRKTLPACTIKFPKKSATSKGTATWRAELEFATAQEVDFLKRRFGIKTAEEVPDAIRHMIFYDIVISLDERQLTQFCNRFGVGNAIELSEKLRSLLEKRLVIEKA